MWQVSASWEMEFEFECGVLIDGGGEVNGGVGNEWESKWVGENRIKS